jgi:large subunit ribosomal protein L33
MKGPTRSVPDDSYRSHEFREGIAARQRSRSLAQVGTCGPSAAAVEENPMRDIIKLTCGTCSRANYHTTKNKRTMTEKFVIKKFCPACRKHLEHKEGKISRG